MRERVTILFAHFGIDRIVGSERCLLDLMAHLDGDVYRPVLVCNTDTVAKAARDIGVTVHAGPQFTPPDQLMPARKLVSLGRTIIARERVQLVHVNAFEHVKWLLPCTRHARIPLVLHVHLPSTAVERCYSLAHQVSCVVGSSRSAISGFVQDGLSTERLSVIYNAVDPDRMAMGNATHLRTELGLGPDDVVLGVVGSLIERKNQETVLESFALLRRAGHTNLHLLLIGDGPDQQYLQGKAAALGVSDNTTFLGHRADAVAVLRDAVDIAVTGAREEVFPLNVLEAGYLGLPIVASDIPPHKEGIEHERTGLVVPTFEAPAYADALERLVTNRALRASMGEAARKRIEARFLLQRYVTEFSALYDRLMAQPSFRHSWLGGSCWPRVYTDWLSRSVGLGEAARSTMPSRP